MQIDELPDEALLINDTGAAELAAGDFGGLKLKPGAVEEVRNYDYKQELKRENTCVAPSVAFYMQAPFPMELYHGRDMVVFKMEYFDLYRVVFLDGRAHPRGVAAESTEAPGRGPGHHSSLTPPLRAFTSASRCLARFAKDEAMPAA